ncbi:GH3 family [Arabidopsis thaliana x Arabidopsis arenosa]|uniref:GH3 family n=1 Tax=Arabidopsis thaliana x Arabidopsis arenosa TaxID=1240361 RepID=A0A8T2C9M5_9BRAS|nr:GH3 family [Arabidopsis thaliana x Arabidopsis arenosa]
MSLSSHLKYLEELTTNAKQVQDNLLEEILRVNGNTEYLRHFLHGSSNKESFKKNVPVVTYDDVNPYIERVAKGEPSNVITGETITNFLLSSGTSGGKQKIFPVNNKYIDGVRKGKVMTFLNTRPLSTTPSGLPIAPLSTSFLMSDYFKNLPSKCYVSPDEVILCVDNKQNMYCHLLCGLVQREEVVSISAAFASYLVQAIQFLETHWNELCGNIRSGCISEWITDPGCRDSVSVILGGPNPELAYMIEHECSQKSWEGMITRLWPNSKFIQTIVTGQMSQYIPILEFYSNKLPLVSPRYASSETIFGVNLNPLCKPQDVSYTFLPNMSYFEFLLVDEANNDEIVELVNVKLGCFYEPLVTNNFGLCRYRMGDILQVTGFYNSAPQFRFVRRKGMVLSVNVEVTTEQDILKALNHAGLVLESSALMLMGFTCYVDISTFPGHYVFYWELKAKSFNGIVKLDNKVMVECCCVIEESFDVLYRKLRTKYGSIGALEIRVVAQGTFDSLMEYFISKGASTSQYKTPICINAPQGLAILEDKVLARFFSDKSPPL